MNTKALFKKLKNKKVIWIVLVVMTIIGSLPFMYYYRVRSVVSPHIYTDIQKVPHNKVGLVLGTARYVVGGSENLYFKYRIEAAAELFFSGKVDYLLVSGDNADKSYNEPREMWRALVAKGVPEDRIILDFAGFRTLDSVVRCAKVFQQRRFTVISQNFHNERAVYIARSHGYDAIGYNAKSVVRTRQMKMREVFARVKMFLDLFIVNKQPKFLGDPVPIGAPASS